MSSREHQQYDEQLVIRYLLGSVPEAEAERLDELSVADEEFASRLAAVENDLVDAYVRGEMAAETRDRFQSYYLSSSRRREKVNFAEALLAVPVPSAAPESIPAPAQGRANSIFLRFLPRRRAWRYWPPASSCIKTLSFGIDWFDRSKRLPHWSEASWEARKQIEKLAQAATADGGLAIVLSPQLRGPARQRLSPFTLEASRPISNWNSSRVILRNIAHSSGLQRESQIIWQSGALRPPPVARSGSSPLSLPAGGAEAAQLHSGTLRHYGDRVA